MTDIFRKEYHPLSDEQKVGIARIKNQAELLLDLINDVELVRDQSCRAVAVTNLEQAVMWAIKAIT